MATSENTHTILHIHTLHTRTLSQYEGNLNENINIKGVKNNPSCVLTLAKRNREGLRCIGRFQAIKTDVLLIFSFITGDKNEFLSPMMFSNEYITGI